MAFVFNKSIAYIGNSDDPNTLNIIPSDAAGKCMTLDGTKEWNYDNSLPAGTRWISRTGGGVTSVKVTKFLTSGTWNVDPNTKFMIIDMIGGGGGGRAPLRSGGERGGAAGGLRCCSPERD